MLVLLLLLLLFLFIKVQLMLLNILCLVSAECTYEQKANTNKSICWQYNFQVICNGKIIFLKLGFLFNSLIANSSLKLRNLQKFSQLQTLSSIIPFSYPLLIVQIFFFCFVFCLDYFSADFPHHLSSLLHWSGCKRCVQGRLAMSLCWYFFIFWRW